MRELDDLCRRVHRFVEEATAFATLDPPDAQTAARFDRLANEALLLQGRTLTPYRRLLEARDFSLAELAAGRSGWRNAPPVPTAAFQELRLALEEGGVVFRSSGTTTGGGRRSEHHHTRPDLYRAIVRSSFPPAVLVPEIPDRRADPPANPERRPILSLIPPVDVVADSSLGFMTDYVVRSFGDRSSAYAFEDSRLHRHRALRWLEARAAGERPVLLTTALALWALLDDVESRGGDRWPTDLVIMETGGFKTRRFEVTRNELLDRLERLTGVPRKRVVREYGMTELGSQAYSLVLHGADTDELHLPPWIRARALDPGSMEEVPAGEPGVLSFLDLGNVASVVSVVTEDLGTITPESGGHRFHLLGRAADAQLRGCSLTTEQLIAADGEER